MENGTRVAYTAEFVRTVGGSTYGVAERRGTITSPATGRADLVRVKWDDADEAQLVRVSNLAIPGPNSRFGGR